MKNLQLILLMSVCIALWGCSQSNKDEVRSQEELDSLVEEIWIEVNEWQPIPLKQWLSQSGANEVDFLTREEAITVSERSLKEHGIELLAVVDDDMPHWTQFVIAKIEGLKDKRAYTQALVAASASRKIEVEYGIKWIVLTEAEEGDPAQ